jgi:hypothetical protein
MHGALGSPLPENSRQNKTNKPKPSKQGKVERRYAIADIEGLLYFSKINSREYCIPHHLPRVILMFYLFLFYFIPFYLLRQSLLMWPRLASNS